jgi:hypothetical protein
MKVSISLPAVLAVSHLVTTPLRVLAQPFEPAPKATPARSAEPVPISTTQPLRLRYRVLVHDGTLTPAQLDNLLREYAVPSSTTPNP